MLFTVREGKLSGRESFFLGDIHEEKREAVVGEFIKQYYFANVMIPKEILVTKLPDDAELLAAEAAQNFGYGSFEDDMDD